MERTRDGRILVVADTNFLVNFLVIDRLDLLAGLQALAFRVPNHVVLEVEYADEKERLHAALAAGTLSEIEITDISQRSSCTSICAPSWGTASPLAWR